MAGYPPAFLVAGRQYTNPETSSQATRRWGGGSVSDNPTQYKRTLTTWPPNKSGPRITVE